MKCYLRYRSDLTPSSYGGNAVPDVLPHFFLSAETKKKNKNKSIINLMLLQSNDQDQDQVHYIQYGRTKRKRMENWKRFNVFLKLLSNL